MAASNPPPLDIDIFHPFPRLPKELHTRIWKLYLAAQARVLTVRSNPPARFSGDIQYFFSPDSPPPTLYACQESRLEALSFYTKAVTSGSNPRFIWMNFDLDTIKIEDGNLCRIGFVYKTCIQQLIVEADNAEYFWAFCLSEFEPIAMLRNLEILSPEWLYVWSGLLSGILKGFQERFGFLPGYVCPQIRIVQKGTLWEMNVHNYRAIARSGRELWRARGRGREAGQGRGNQSSTAE